MLFRQILLVRGCDPNFPLILNSILGATLLDFQDMTMVHRQLADDRNRHQCIAVPILIVDHLILQQQSVKSGVLSGEWDWPF